MTVRTPTLQSVIRAHVAAGLSDVNVALPGRVESYDSSRQRAVVQPLIRRGYADESGDRQAESLPAIAEVPVMFPGSGDFSIDWPVARGDTGLLVFASASLDRWLALGGEEVDPEDDRRHALTDAVFYPGLRPSPLAGPATRRIKFTSTQIQAGGTEALAKNSDLEDLRSAIALAGSGNAVPGAAGGLGPFTGTAVLKGS